MVAQRCVCIPAVKTSPLSSLSSPLRSLVPARHLHDVHPDDAALPPPPRGRNSARHETVPEVPIAHFEVIS